MTVSTYTDHVQTGAQWPDSLPATWNFKRLKFAASLVGERQEAALSELPYIGLENIESWTGRTINPSASSAEGLAGVFQPNDVLFGKLRPYLAKVMLAKEDGLATTEAIILRANEDVIPSFLRYFLATKQFISDVDSSTYGAKMPRASWDFIGNRIVPVPPAAEQKAITAFLDEKVGRIDALISHKEELLLKLEEERSSIITRTVTLGYEATHTYKATGVEWFPHIPSAWSFKRLKFILQEPLMYGANEAGEFEDTDWPRFIRITDVNSDGTLRPETFKSLPPEIAAPYRLRAGDILLARSGATVGKSFKYDDSWGDAAFAGYLIRARFPTEIADYMAWYFHTQTYWEWVKGIFIQATIQNISAEKYNNLWVPLPPALERKKIVRHIEEQVAKIDDVRRSVEGAIRRLTEYRFAIITAAVTGQIKVV